MRIVAPWRLLQSRLLTPWSNGMQDANRSEASGYIKTISSAGRKVRAQHQKDSDPIDTIRTRKRRQRYCCRTLICKKCPMCITYIAKEQQLLELVANFARHWKNQKSSYLAAHSCKASRSCRFALQNDQNCHLSVPSLKFSQVSCPGQTHLMSVPEARNFRTCPAFWSSLKSRLRQTCQVPHPSLMLRPAMPQSLQDVPHRSAPRPFSFLNFLKFIKVIVKVIQRHQIVSKWKWYKIYKMTNSSPKCSQETARRCQLLLQLLSSPWQHSSGHKKHFLIHSWSFWYVHRFCRIVPVPLAVCVR